MNRRVGTNQGSTTTGTGTDNGRMEGGELAVKPELDEKIDSGQNVTAGAARPGKGSTNNDGETTPQPVSAPHGKGDVGQILRGAYRQTVDEAIPDDLMDLLNKLE